MIEDMDQCSSEENDSLEFRSENLLKNEKLRICHELRTPLTSIRGALGLLYSGHFGYLSKEGERVLEIAIENTNRLTRLADAIESRPISPMVVLSEEAVARLHLENDLYTALKRQEFYLVYQPIIATENHQIIGFEALARWQHLQKGLISPDIFIPIAEKIGFIHQLGLEILRQACCQLKVWQQQFPVKPLLTMSVNLSTLQLLQPNLIQEIQKILEESDVIPSSLKLEVTESALIENQQVAIRILGQLKAMGIQLYVDDFGSGYSSLRRLQELPINALKIDRSFVQRKQWDISETIVLLAAKLGLDVIAEGVETNEDLAALQAIGCNKMQGYLFSKPLNAQAVTELIQAFQPSCYANHK